MNRPIFKIFILTGIFAVFLSCSKLDDSSSSVETGPAEQIETPDQESWQSTIIITKDGRRVARVWANYVATYENRKQTVLKDSIHVNFYDRNGKQKSVLTAREGIVDNVTENLRAIGNVVVVSDSGVVLETEELLWDNQKQKIVSEVPVKFTTKTDTLLGDGFISDPDLANYEIRNAKGVSKRNIKLDKP
jgi:LPS export ABC transporter protein LptC